MGWLRDKVRKLLRKKGADRESRAAFRLQYERFREILALNDKVLGLLADIEVATNSEKPFALEAFIGRIRQGAMDVFIMVKDLHLISGGKYQGLFQALARVNQALEEEAAPCRPEGEVLMPFERVRLKDVEMVGEKMARLGEVAATLGLLVPDGFVVTKVAFLKFMEEEGLWERAARLEEIVEVRGPSGLAEACREVADAICKAKIPKDVEEAILDMLGKKGGGFWAVRSSVLGEDTETWSHAGIYRTLLSVPSEKVIEAYKEVVASAFSPIAVTYRFERGLPLRNLAIAVGLQKMVEPRSAGVLFTRNPNAPEENVALLSARGGLGDCLVAGTAQDAENWMLRPGQDVEGGGLERGDAERLLVAGRRIESLFGGPQDVEWALDRQGRLYVLQARPLKVGVQAQTGEPRPLHGKVLLSGGQCASPGIGVGPVFVARDEAEISRCQEGAVLVTRNATTALAQVLGRVAAVVTELGCPVGHTAVLAREIGVPMVVGVHGACYSLREGERVAVYAERGEVLEAEGIEISQWRKQAREKQTPAHEVLQRLARHLVPLNLTDPASEEFRPENAKTLHDITRFVHEKAFEVMFFFGDRAASLDTEYSFRLEAPLPMEIRVFDVGGGVKIEAETGGKVRAEDILSKPMKALLQGMLKVKWDEPRLVSARGFFSVVGSSIVGPPTETLVGRLSYAIVSDKYVNFSTRAGYHFSTVDAWCGKSSTKNYIHFRFHGGAADPERRMRRVLFLDEVLRALDFRTKVRGDFLVARLEKVAEEIIEDRLYQLGRLTMTARQMDMLMDSDQSPGYFAQAFLRGELDGN